MYHYLKDHPEVFMPTEKEPGFFADEGIETIRICESETEYLRLFTNVESEPVVGEASTTYLGSELAAVRIKEFNRAAKILVMLRDPVDFMYALHFERKHRRFTDLDFADALNAQAAGEDSVDYLQLARDWPQAIHRFVDAFGVENVMLLILEEFAETPHLWYSKVLNFLALEDQVFQPEFTVHNRNKSDAFSITNLLVSLGVYDRIKIAKQLLYRYPTVYGALARSIKAKDKARPELDHKLRSKLSLELEETKRWVEEFLHRDIPSWGSS